VPRPAYLLLKFTSQPRYHVGRCLLPREKTSFKPRLSYNDEQHCAEGIRSYEALCNSCNSSPHTDAKKYRPPYVLTSATEYPAEAKRSTAVGLPASAATITGVRPEGLRQSGSKGPRSAGSWASPFAAATRFSKDVQGCESACEAESRDFNVPPLVVVRICIPFATVLARLILSRAHGRRCAFKVRRTRRRCEMK